jgi:uncharacterized protein YkwD
MTKLKRALKWTLLSFGGLAILFALLCAAALLTKPGSAPTDVLVQPGDAPVDKLESADIDKVKLYDLINSERTKAGLGQLSINSALNDSAQAKCDDMVANNYWSHEDTNGQMPWALILSHYGSYTAIGENLAYGTLDAEETVKDWMASPEHKANIVNPVYKDVGYAVCYSPNYVNDSERLIVVQHFARK